MSHAVRFVCDKDQLLADYYEQCFGEWFQREFDELLPHFASGQEVVDSMLWVWNERMRCEAKIQDHYDFIVNDQGRREVIYGTDRQPKLLIPDIAVEEVANVEA